MSTRYYIPHVYLLDRCKRVGTCWMWTGTLFTGPFGGYGQAWWDGKHRMAHKLSFSWYRGEVPAGLELDHTCRNRACINPYHLEPVTRRENVRRGVSIVAVQMAKTHCKHGHLLQGWNLLPRVGRRDCRPCNYRNRTARRKRMREEKRCLSQS